MNKLNKYISIEIFLSLLFIFTYFMPWVDMAMFVKVVGWDIPFIQSELTAMSKEFTANQPNLDILYAIFIIPLLALCGVISSLANKLKIARYVLATSSILSLILTVALFFNLPNLGSGIWMLSILSVVSLIYSIISLKTSK